MQRGSEAEAAGVRLILIYKLIKAVLQVAAAVVLFYGARHGLTAKLTHFAEQLRHHAVYAGSNLLARAILKFTHARHGLVWTGYAALADAVLSGVEAYALWRGYTWGEWLVVGTTASLIPFEIWALSRHLRVGRVVLLVLNLVIVWYLVNRARHRHVKGTSDPGAGPPLSARLGTSAALAGAGRR
ncbi:MAG TPA: DUF2127 domain-containing protein [Polyangia bacterium]|nr:DUF2127 domain-containing protein [Polyangia bacterium]